MTLSIEISETLRQQVEARAAEEGVDVKEWMHALVKTAVVSRWPSPAERRRQGTARMQKIAAGRGLNWDTMTEEEQLSLINQIRHE